VEEAEGLLEAADEGQEQLSAPIALSRPVLTAGRPGVGKPFNIHAARFRLALCSIALLAFVVVAAFVGLYLRRSSIEDITRLLEIMFAPLVALVAAAVAFYYRSNPPP
jgi:hypothetical protein